MIYQSLLIFALFILLYSLFAKKVESTIISGPFLALGFGLIMGPLGFSLFGRDGAEGETYRVIAELALALVLFSDAAKTNLVVLKNNIKIPTRLLLISLPITIVFGFIGGYLIFEGFSWIELALLASMLAPTDAALGKAVVSNPAVPSRIREALNVESGLNDGICVPILFLLLAFLKVDATNSVGFIEGVTIFAEEIGIGVAVGVTLTYIAFRVARFAHKREWISETWKTMVVIALAFSCFNLAQISGGSGFIACFVGGLVYGALTKEHRLHLLESAEGAGDSLSMLTWVIFGAVVIAKYYASFTWEVLLYSLLSLTVIRIVPTLISLINSGVSMQEQWFIGWFGPRGLASIVFAVIVIEAKLPHQTTIILTVICTILLSVVLHGLTANPFIKLLGSRDRS